MSFILDALKKSETERQRQATPGLIDANPIAPKPRFPLWAIAIGVLLGVNLIVLIVVLTRGDHPAAGATGSGAVSATSDGSASARNGLTPDIAHRARDIAPFNNARPMGADAQNGAAPQPAATSVAPLVADSTTDAPASASNFSPLDAPVFAPEIPVSQESRGSAGAPGAQRSTAGGAAMMQPGASNATGNTNAARNGFAPGANSQAPSEPRLARSAADRENDEVLPTLDEMNLSGQHGIPEMHLDIHVYDSRPAARFVFINMRKYREGAALQEGPTVERITREGVILNYQGLRFTLPRQ